MPWLEGQCTCGGAQSRKGLRIVIKTGGNGNRYGTRCDGLTAAPSSPRVMDNLGRGDR